MRTAPHGSVDLHLAERFVVLPSAASMTSPTHHMLTPWRHCSRRRRARSLIDTGLHTHLRSSVGRQAYWAPHLVAKAYVSQRGRARGFIDTGCSHAA